MDRIILIMALLLCTGLSKVRAQNDPVLAGMIRHYMKTGSLQHCQQYPDLNFLQPIYHSTSYSSILPRASSSHYNCLPEKYDRLVRCHRQKDGSIYQVILLFPKLSSAQPMPDCFYHLVRHSNGFPQKENRCG